MSDNVWAKAKDRQRERERERERERDGMTDGQTFQFFEFRSLPLIKFHRKISSVPKCDDRRSRTDEQIDRRSRTDEQVDRRLDMHE